MIPLRDDAPRYSSPGVTWFLIGLNLLIYLFEASLPRYSQAAFVAQFSLIPTAFTHPGWHGAPYITLFTSMFIHAGWAHVIPNMWFLWIFGDNVEDHFGHFRYLMLYLVCGVAAAVLQIALTPDSRVPTVGASGAIAGIMGAYFALFPSARVLMFFPIFFFWLPAWIVLGYWFIMQFLSGAASSIGPTASTVHGGIAFWAHVGGFASGLVLSKLIPAQHIKMRY
jgi:membrane associated rhomboid family serine protease